VISSVAGFFGTADLMGWFINDGCPLMSEAALRCGFEF